MRTVTTMPDLTVPSPLGVVLEVSAGAEDKATGYVTQNLLVMPILDVRGSCMGVMQAINKHGAGTSHAFLGRSGACRGSFEPADEILMTNLADQVSVALQNAEFYRAAIVTSDRANAASLSGRGGGEPRRCCT